MENKMKETGGYEKAEMIPMSDFELDNYNGGGVVVPIVAVAAALVAAVGAVYIAAIGYNAVVGVNAVVQYNYT